MPRRYFDDDDDDMDDELDLDFAETDEEEDDDEEEQIMLIEQAFRRERAHIRAAEDLHELRSMRTVYQESIAEGQLNQAGRIRSNDLIELIDDKITDVKARRMAARNH